MRRRVGIFAAIGATLSALAVGGIGVLSASARGEPQVTLCHARASVTNPYGPQPITVDQSAVFNNGVVPNGHGTHTGPIFPADNWGDIIPAFGAYPGLNNSPVGLAILANNCQIPGLPTPTNGPPTVVPPGAGAPAAAVTAAPTFTG